MDREAVERQISVEWPEISQNTHVLLESSWQLEDFRQSD